MAARLIRLWVFMLTTIISNAIISPTLPNSTKIKGGGNVYN